MKKYQLRKGAGTGSWCSVLLPFCLLPYATFSSFGIYKLLFVICCWISASCSLKLNVYSFEHSCTLSHYIFFGLLSFPISFLISWISLCNIFFSFLFCFVAVLCCDNFTSSLLISCPGSFTLGEVQIISQGTVIFLLSCVLPLILKDNSAYNFREIQMTESVHFIEALLLGCFLLVLSLHMFPPMRHGAKFYFLSLSIASIMLYALRMYYGKNPFIWLLEFCIHSNQRIFLLLYWFTASFASVLFVIWENLKPRYKASTVSRKYFHFIVNAVYIPGILYDVELLNLASCVALIVFLVLEMCRILNVFMLGPVIANAFQVFLDEKDSGVLILTHIYLLVGCSCPLWLYGPHLKGEEYHICLLSGILSVGFGDTAAAIGGSLFGKHYWKGSKKTYEGTICAVITQLFVCCFFLQFGHRFSLGNILLVIIAVLFTSFLEAKTTQVDNLVLPLLMFSFLSWVQ